MGIDNPRQDWVDSQMRDIDDHVKSGSISEDEANLKRELVRNGESPFHRGIGYMYPGIKKV